jgi:phosphate-selective porin OprO/OprP
LQLRALPLLRSLLLAVAVVFPIVDGGRAQAQPPPPDAVPSTDSETLRRELDELRARQRELERRLDAVSVQPIAPAPVPHVRAKRPAVTGNTNGGDGEANTNANGGPVPASVPADAVSGPSLPAVPRFRLGREGFVFGTPDGRHELRLHAVVQSDARIFVGGTRAIPDTMLVRRARLSIEGTVFGIADFRIMPDFGAGQTLLQDAYVELHPWAWLRLKFGKFKSPFGLEFLQSDTATVFLERSLANNLVPFHDTGLMLGGDVAGGTFSYAAAIMNGAQDGANGPDLTLQDAKDYVGRIFIRPLRTVHHAAWINLGFGVAGSYGKYKGTAAPTLLQSYRSTDQQPMFTYLAATAMLPTGQALPMGQHWRVSPQMYLYMGPFGLLGEYVMSSHKVERLDQSTNIDNRAWNVTATFMLTLEQASYETVVPRRPVDFRHKNFGAFELALRYSELRIDERAFPEFADPTLSAREAREFAAGLNWHLTEFTKIMASYHRTDFVGGGSDGTDRESVNAIMIRLQLAL